MALQIKSTAKIVDPATYKFKGLIYSFPGMGKTKWASTSPNPGIVACETGEGNGLLTIANENLDYIEPTTYADFEAICSGHYFKDKDTIVIDSLSDMCRTFIKDYALTIPRAKGQSDKRRMGVPELDDYGVMGEITRRLLRKLLNIDKHIIVTATIRFDKPDPETGQGQLLVGPDLPGQLFLGSTAMFDLVLCLMSRNKLATPGDPKSRFSERYFLCQPDETHIVKCRASRKEGGSLLDAEELFSLKTGQGNFPYLFNKIISKYQSLAKEAPSTD